MQNNQSRYDPARDPFEWKVVLADVDTEHKSLRAPKKYVEQMPPKFPSIQWTLWMSKLDPDDDSFAKHFVKYNEGCWKDMPFNESHCRLVAFCRMDPSAKELVIEFLRLDTPDIWPKEKELARDIISRRNNLPNSYFLRQPRYILPASTKPFNTKQLRHWFDSYVPQDKVVVCDIRDAMGAILNPEDTVGVELRDKLVEKSGHSYIVPQERWDALLRYFGRARTTEEYDAFVNAMQEIGAKSIPNGDLKFEKRPEPEAIMNYWHRHSAQVIPVLAHPNKDAPRKAFVQPQRRLKDGRTLRDINMNLRAEEKSKMISLPDPVRSACIDEWGKARRGR